MAAITAENLGIEKEEVLVASTGIIGKKLPMEKIKKGIIEAVENLSYTGGNFAATSHNDNGYKVKRILN